jgi:serine/threonine-protein kinase
LLAGVLAVCLSGGPRLGGSWPVEAWVGEGLGGEAGGVLAGFSAGSRVAGYLLEEQVGAGGMAVVFRARDERLHRLVALKVLGPAMAADEDFRSRFIGESRAAAAVEDPHIIPVHEAGEADGVLFIAMRYVAGGDVRTLLRRAGPLPPSQAAAIISPVASALDSAHAAGLVHRDVKPANMLLDVRPGRPDHVYLSDFGLSKGVLSLGLTRSGHFLGTPGYSAPEQIRGLPVDGRADQYALACTAFELLCGGAVFPRDEVLAAIYAHLSEPPPQLTARRAGTPDAADGVFARALAKEPADRYASCREFADELRRVFALPPHYAAQETGPQLDHPAFAGTGNGIAAASHDPILTVTRSAPLHNSAQAAVPGRHRQAAGSQWAQPTSRKPAVTRRTMLGLAAATAAAAGLAATGWELSNRTTPRRTPARHPPPGGTLLWTTTIPKNGINMGPVDSGDIIYVSDLNSPTQLYALSASTGHVLWHHPGGAPGQMPAPSVAAISHKMVYTVTSNNTTYGVAAYNANTGTRTWDLPAFLGPGGCGPIVAGSILFVADITRGLCALRTGNGRVLWTYPIDGVPVSLTAAGETAYVASVTFNTRAPGYLYAIRSGRRVWYFPSPSEIRISPIIGSGFVYIITDNGNVYALRADNGHEVWNSRIGTDATGAYLADGIVYVGDRTGKLSALRAADGRIIWQAPKGTSGSQGFSIATDKEAVYVSNGDGEVNALRTTDGTKIWRLATGGSSPVVTVARNTVYIGSNNIYAVGASDGKRKWAFPVWARGLTTAPGIVYASTAFNVYALRA